MKNQMHFLIFFVSFLMIGSLFVQTATFTDDQDVETSVEPTFESNDFIIEPVDMENENIEIIDESILTQAAASRSSARESPDYGNSFTAAHDLGDPPVSSISGVLSGASDEDWFKVRLKGDDGSGQVDNLTIKPTNLNSNGYYWRDTDTFQVYILGVYDYGGPFPTNKLVYMDVQGYRAFNNYQTNWLDCTSLAFNTGDYYIMVKGTYSGNGNQITYTFSINVKSDTIQDRNQKPDTAVAMTDVPKEYKVDQGRDIFDWYKLESTAGKDIPMNFSFTLDITGSQPAWTETKVFPRTVTFICEVIVVVMHDPQKAPVAILKGSISNLQGLNKTIFYAENTTETTSYVGVYCQMYGIDDTGSGPYSHVDFAPNTDKYMGGYAKYKLRGSKLQILQSVLVEKTVTPFRGRTYDDYVFSVMYKDANNKAPLLTRIKVDDRPIEEMEFKEFNFTYNNYKDGAVYEYMINGVKLGEGWHSFTYYFKDPDGYSIGALVANTGPYITDNVEPQIRVTATDTIKIEEDAPPFYVDLLKIFDDAENDDMEFKLQQGNSWVSTIDTSIAGYSVRSNDTLRITPKANAYGLDNLFINATDSNGNWIVQPFEYKIEVTAVNDPPQIKKYLGEWDVIEDSKISGIDLNDYFHDPIEPEQTLEFGYDNIDNIEIVLDALGANVIITPDENWYGEVIIRFSANDGFDTIYNVMRLNVIAVNDPPVFNNPKGFTTNESEWFHRDLVAYDPIEGDSVRIETNLTDEVNDQLLRIKRIVTPTIGGIVEGENLLLETNEKNTSIHHFSFLPTNEMAGGGESSFTGIYYINFTAVDSGGARVTHNVIMTIMNMNQPPEPKINKPINESIFYTNDLIYFFGDAGDPDVIHGGHNFYTWSSNLDGELGKLKYVGPIQLETEGIHTITLEVGDGEQVGRATILLTVREPFNGTTSEDDGADDVNTLGLTSTETNMYMMIIALVILVVLSVIAIVLSGLSKKTATKKLKTELAPDELRLPEEVQKLLAPQKAICGHCGSVLQVVSKHRPLSVLCQECGNKSVVYHPGNAVLQAGVDEHMQVPLPAEEPQPLLPSADQQ